MHVAVYHEAAGSRHAGGIAVYVRELSMALAAAGHEVTMLTGPGEVPERLATSGVAVVRVPPWPGRNGGTTGVADLLPGLGEQSVAKLRQFAGGLRDRTLRRTAREADLVWTHQYLDDLLVSQVASPTVYHYHGVRSVGPGARARERLSRTRHHLANSEPTAGEVRRRLGREVDGVVRPGVALDRFRPDADRAFDRVGPTVLFVGRLTAEKGVHDLLDAVARLAAAERADADARPDAGNRADDLHCVLVGRGDEAALRARARERGIEDRVTLAGSVPHRDLPGYYAAADVACVPAHYESFGMANLEAMACGTPVVATEACRADAVRAAAVLVPPGDPAALADELADLLASPDRRARLAEAGRETARRHAWSRRADDFVAACGPLVG